MTIISVTFLLLIFSLCIAKPKAIIAKMAMGLNFMYPLKSRDNNENMDLVIPQLGHGIPNKYLIGHPLKTK